MSSPSTSVFSLAQSLRRQIASNRLNEALTSIQATVENVFNEPLCTAQIFGTKFLDEVCQRIGARTIESHAPSPTAKTRVYLVSKLQKSGGHTRVLGDIIRSSPPEWHHIILSTELLGPSDRAAVEKSLYGHPVTFEWNADVTSLQKLVWVQSRLRAIAPAEVWLFNHHQDSVIVAAVQPRQGYKTFFYHHGDHHICLGLYLPDTTHIDPLPMGYHHCRDHMKIADNVYLPLWMPDRGDRTAPYKFLKDGVVTTCTAANANKVEAPYFIRYVEMIPAILRASGGRHIHIGKLTPWALWKMRRALKTNGIEPARFIHIPWVESVWSALQSHHVDLYLSSFPYAGARTLIEAMGSATPLVVHDHYLTGMLSSADVAYPQAFVWRDPEDLYAFLEQITADFLQMQAREARAFFLAHHNAHAFAGFDTSLFDKISPPPPLRAHQPDLLQWGLSAIGQITLRGLIWRFIYRRRRYIKKLLWK